MAMRSRSSQVLPAHAATASGIGRGVGAATDLFGPETAHAALALGVPAGRVSTIAVRDPELTVRAVRRGAGRSGTHLSERACSTVPLSSFAHI